MKDITIKMSLGMLCLCCTFFAAAQPVASFLINAPSSTCTPATFSFSNLSSGEGALNFDWQFGDNTATDTSTNPFHTYQECGSFEVILSVTDTTGQIAADTQQVIINCTPIAAFNFSPPVICDSAMVHFTDLSVPADSIVAWQWNFGDPVSGAADTSLIQNPTHYYHTPGLFNISLSVTSIAGCLSVATDSILVIQPQAYYSLMNSACVNASTFFIDLSTSQDAIVSWFWNFDDPASGNNTSNVQYPAHVFSQAGDYNVRLTISTETGCTNVWQKYIHVYGLPLVNAGSDQSMCAFDSVQLEASGALVYEWQPESLLSNALVPNPFAFPLNTQDFFVTGTDENGCSAQDTVKVTVLALPQASAGNDTAICEGTSVLLNGSGGISFQWSPANTLDNDTIAQPLATPDSNTTYIVTVKDESGCSASDSVAIQVSPFPVVSIFGINAQYCSNGDSVELNALPSGGLFSGDGVMNNFLHPAMLSAGGPYSIVYSFTNETGCTADDTALFFIVAPMPITISTTDSLLCLNGTAISFELFPEGGILSGNGINNNLFDPSLAGAGMHQVYYQITDTNNCKAFDSLKITVFELPAVSAGNDTVICSGDSIELQATGGLNYSWSPAASLTDSAISNPVAFPLVATQYEVMVVDSNGCSNKDSVLITVFSMANVDAGMNDTICKGDTIPLTATGGAAYAWSPSEGLSATNISNPYAFPEVTTMYTVTVNSGSSCPGLDSVLITVHALPAVNAGIDQSLCNGDSVQLDASGAANYTWQPSINLSNSEVADPFAFPETSTYYTVAGTDTNGCSAIDSVLINVLSLPVIDAGNDTSICAGDSLQLSASGGISYQWTPGIFLSDDSIYNPLAFPDTNTIFIVTGSNAAACSNTDSIHVFVLTSSQVDAGNDTAICKGDSVTLHASGGFYFSWSPSEGLSNDTVADPVAYPINTTTYTVTVSAGSDCTFSDTVKIFVNELPVVDAGIDSAVCPGDSLQLLASGALIYIWNPSASLSDPDISNPWASPTVATAYFVTGTDGNGCKNSDSVTINLLNAPVADAGVDTAICAGDSILLQASGGITYSWQPALSLSNAFISNPVAKPTNTTAYIVAVNDGGACSGYDTVIITVYPLPVANAGDDQTVCAGDTVHLNATGGDAYFWTPATGLSSDVINNPSVIVNTSITYQVTVTDQNNCSSKDTIHLEVVPPLMTSVSNDTSICVGSSVHLFAGGGTYYSWFPASELNDPISASPIATPSETTAFTVVISDGICDMDTLQVMVLVSTPIINAGNDVTITAGTPYQLNVSASAGDYLWLPSESLNCSNCINPVATPLVTTTYTVSVTDSIGCIASDDITLTVGCDAAEIFIPNAFTPDNNGHNDVLFVRSTGIITVNYFRIFDRWGKIIFESNDINEGWDGTYKNQLMPPGVYLYTLKATCGNDEVIEKQGNVTLIN